MLIFEKINEVNFIVTVEHPKDYYELEDLQVAFTSEHPQKHNIKAYIMGRWDGKIRYLKFVDQFKEKLLCPLGLFDLVYQYMRYCDVPFRVINDDIGIRDLDLSDFDEFIEDIHPKHLEQRDYQVNAVKKALTLNRGILESPTGSGKSNVIYMFIRSLFHYDLKSHEKVLLVVPTIDLVGQMADDLISYGMNPDWIKRIHGGEEKVFNRPVIISTWQSLQRYPQKFFEQFQCLIIDEVHKAIAAKLTAIGEFTINARMRLGTTGTLHNDPLLKQIVLANFGPIFKTSTTMSLVRDNYLTDFHITNVVLNWNYKVGNKKYKFDAPTFKEEYDLIINNPDRMDMLVRFVKKLWKSRDVEKGCVLILGKRVEHIETMFSMLYKIFPDNTFLIHGKIHPKIRKKILAEVKSKGGLLISNIDIMGTGVNIPAVTDIVFVNPIKSDILLIQSVGRSIRLFEGKDFAQIYDIVDRIPIVGKSHNSVYNWLNSKCQLYKNQNFKFDIIEVDMDVQK